MNTIERFPALVCAAISGYCMGGGLEPGACVPPAHRRPVCHLWTSRRRVRTDHRLGWDAVLIGKAKALEMFVTAGKLDAREALRIGLVDAVSDDPVGEAMARLTQAN